MRVANAQLRSEWQRLKIHRLDREGIGLSRRAINNLSTVMRPRRVREVPLRLKSVLLFQCGNGEQRNGIVGPVSVNLNHAGERLFIRAERSLSIAAKCPFLSEFRFVSLPFETSRYAEFACGLSGKRAFGQHSTTPTPPQPQRCAFAARACFHKVFLSTRPHQTPRNDTEFSECAQKHFAVQIEGMQRGLPPAPGCHQLPRSRAPGARR